MLAGMRTFAPPAWVLRPESMWVRRLLPLAAAFEALVIDKMPFVRMRTTPPQLAGRVISGAVCAIYANRLVQGRFNRITAGITGGVAAFIGTYVAFNLRRRAAERLGLPDRLAGAVEDVASVGLGKLLAG